MESVWMLDVPGPIGDCEVDGADWGYDDEGDFVPRGEDGGIVGSDLRKYNS